MAIRVETKRKLICDECLTDITPLEDESADELRFKYKSPPYRGKDFCDECHPIPKEERGGKGRKPKSFYTGMK